MKKILGLLVLLSFMASCSDDDDNNNNGRHEIEIDDKLIKSVELMDVTNGEEIPFGVIDLKYDNERRLTKVKVQENDVNGKVMSLNETLFSYDSRKISYSTMNEEGYSVWLTKGSFDLDKSGRAVRGQQTEDDKSPANFNFKYDGNHYLISTLTRAKNYESESDLEWSDDNVILFDWVEDDRTNSVKRHEYERIEYTSYYNNASIDLARMICFGSEGSEGVKLMGGSHEGSYLDIFGRRVRNMPMRMTALTDGVKEVKDFEYSRDRNNRIYEIKVKKVRTYRNEQVETKEYRYNIGY